ncbi:MAG: lipoate--protein ligase family protein [Planctomycetaceae bacterium]|nr:lipoate--protein ligase family protein [Planctomycetaceae bacterium]
MRYLDLTLPTAAENLALDEALLEEAEAGEGDGETLRLWEAREPMVVVGRSSRVQEEVRLEACRERGVPVLRRSSGGAAIVAGPGCLMYALVLSYRRRPELRTLTSAHRWVLGRLTAALGPRVLGIRCCGTSDLAIGERKFSGNSARCRRGHLLYHGTLLYDFSLPLIAQCLTMPPRMPDYRGGRQHEEFVMNLPLPRETLRRLVADAFDAHERDGDWPRATTATLAAAKYGRPEWNEAM